MAAVTIRNIDDAVIARLRDKARANDRSLEAELRLLLSDASRRISEAEFVGMTERIRRLSASPPGLDTTSALQGRATA